jgi:hypothetical protein
MSDTGPSSNPLDRLDELARRAVDGFLRFVRKGVRFGLWVLLFVTLVCGVGFALGIAALSGSSQTFWLLLGGGFAIVAIGATLLAVIRLWAIRTTSATLVREVRAMIGLDRANEQVVIDTIETSERSSSTTVVISSNQYGQWQQAIRGRTGEFTAVALALAALASFPRLLGLALLITLTFMALSLVFLAAIVI